MTGREVDLTKEFIDEKLAENEELLESKNFSDPVKLLYAKTSQTLMKGGGLEENLENLYESFVNFDYVQIPAGSKSVGRCAFLKNPSAVDKHYPDESFCRLTRKRIVSWVKFLAQKEFEEFAKSGTGVFLLRGILRRSKIDFYSPVMPAESFGNSLFAGYFVDVFACAMHFMLFDGVNKYRTEQILLKFTISDYIFNNENVADFVYVAPLSVPLGLFSEGEAFHSALYVAPADVGSQWESARNEFARTHSELLSGRIDEIEKEVVEEFLKIVSGEDAEKFSSIIEHGQWFFKPKDVQMTVRRH